MLPIDFNGLDTTVHGPSRLGVLTALRVSGELDFTTLRKRLELTDGALGVHLRKLEDAGYISCHKGFEGRRPRSRYRLTADGTTALAGYVAKMRRLLDALESSPST